MDSTLATLNPDASLEVYHEEATMRKLVFKIPEASPHTISMTRLAQYIAKLATVLGRRQDVHFIKVETGSLPCLIDVEDSAEEEVISRAQSISMGNGTKEALTAFDDLRKYLKEDDYSAALQTEVGDVIIDLPRRIPEFPMYGPIDQEGVLDGLLVNMGGTDDTIPVVLLSEGRSYSCNATVDMVRKLRNYLLEKPIRLRGNGRWFRNVYGKWVLDWFDITSFEELDDSSIPEVVNKLRAIPGNALMNLEDPLEEMRKIRHGE